MKRMPYPGALTGLRTAAAFLAMAPALACAWVEQGGSVPSRPGVRQNFVVTAKEQTESARATHVVIFFTGGEGTIAPPVEGRHEQAPGKPLSARGFLAENVGPVIALDPPSDLREGMSIEWREGESHLLDVAAALDVLMPRYPEARFTLLGYSNGARSATHVAAALGGKWGARLQGVVLVSAAARSLREDWMRAIVAARDAKETVLVVHHRRDSCLPYADIESQARKYSFIALDDARQPRPQITRPDCGPSSAHRFGGREQMAWQAVADWINTGKLPETN